jgi:two-component system nitrate/nitrite sensor histidine kinase NarX
MDIDTLNGPAETGLSLLERERRVALSLRETLAVLNSSRSSETILRFIVHQAREVLSAEAAAIYSPTGQKGLLQIQAQEGLSDEYVREASIPLGLVATGSAALTRQPVMIPDIAAALAQRTLPSDAATEAILEKLSHYYQALLVMPMIFPKGEVYGTLDLYFKSPREFSGEDIALARAYSDQAILAVENARLSRRLEQAAVSSERDRLARDLHDTVTQTLFSAALIADVLPALWEQDPNNGKIALQELSQLSRGALAEMRTLLFELRPASLLSADISTLMQQLVHAFISRTRIPVVYQAAKFDCPMPSDAKIALYRITQELLNNIEKHAQADQVVVIFEQQKLRHEDKRSSMHCRACQNCVRIVVSDNGRGFDMDSITSDHMGLRIIRERAEGIKAALLMESSSGHGTRVEIVW